jgi:hypothetical protein
MRTLGIVGSEGAKFTEETENTARNLLYNLIRQEWSKSKDLKVVSGACHLGGIDVWAIEMAKLHGLETEEFPPAHKSWEKGYKLRNIQISEASDKVICVTIKELPPDYTGMRFPKCYHCNTAEHVKSGGCWTMHHARKAGKEWELYVI